MKIAYIYDASYPWIKGGAERRIYEISRRLAQRGHEVHCYSMKWWEGDKEILDGEVYLHGICKPLKLYSGERRSITEAIYFASKVFLSMGNGFDIVDCQNFPYLPCFSAKLQCLLRSQRLFITWLEVWGDYWNEYIGRKGSFARYIESAALNLAEKNIAISNRTKRDLEDLGVRGVQVVPGGIDLDNIHRVKPSEKESDVFFIGRLVSHKNVDLLIRAVSLVAREDPSIRTIIIGDGPDMEKLKALTTDLGLERNVEFTGSFENYDKILSMMKSSRVFVSPSTREGFGMAALEANACGLPVITVNHRMNAVCDLVTDGTGQICEPTIKGMAEAISKELFSRKTKRLKCIENARGYDWEAVCSLAEKVYE